MWNLSVPWWEFVLRGVVVYLFLLVFLRLTGKRQTGQYAPFDLVLLLILSNAVQNSMNAGDNSLIGGLISATTLLLCHVALARLTYRFRRLERLIDGHARVLVQDGKVDEALMERERISPATWPRPCVPGMPARARGAACHHRSQWADHRGAAPAPAPADET